MTAKGRGASIREGGLADLDAVDRIEQASFTSDRFSRRTLARLLKSPSAAVLIADRGGAAAGFAIVLFRKGARAARLYTIAVDPAARGAGLGESLMRAAMACAIERGCDRLRLEVRDSNAAARNLYSGLGFRIIGRMPAYYSDGADGVKLERRLSSGESEMS